VHGAYVGAWCLGHALMLDEGWQSAAEAIAGWLEEKGL
jgi:hypothetical protein